MQSPVSKAEQHLPVRIRDLEDNLHGAVLCYPGTDLSSFASRKKQLRELGVKELIFEGTSKVGNLGVIGKGCVSVVVKGRFERSKEIVALKCRRIDSNRESMQRDYELQRFANTFGIGPKAISCSNDFFAMEFVESIKIGKWIEKLKTRTSKKFVRSLVRDSLTQCFILDQNGLDHGELSNPSKHILLRTDQAGSPTSKTVVIDFESAGTERKVSNFTSVAQFYFLGGWQSAKFQKILGYPKNRARLISYLKKYKGEPNTTNFSRFMDYVRCEV